MGNKAITKPKIGEPCNGCGICCRIQVCLNGAFVLGFVDKLGDTIKGSCPALTLNAGKWVCGIILNPKKYLKDSKYPATVLSRNFARLVGAGTGCDELGKPPYDPADEAKLDAIIEQMKNNKEWIRKSEIALKVIHNL